MKLIIKHETGLKHVCTSLVLAGVVGFFSDDIRFSSLGGTLLTESIKSDASCRHILCLVLTKAATEEHLSLNYADPKNGSAVSSFLSKGRIIRAYFTQEFRKGLILESGLKPAVLLLCIPVEF